MALCFLLHVPRFTKRFTKRGTNFSHMYPRRAFVVPKTRKARRPGETPDMNWMRSRCALSALRSGLSCSSILLLLSADVISKMMINT